MPFRSDLRSGKRPTINGRLRSTKDNLQSMIALQSGRSGEKHGIITSYPGDKAFAAKGTTGDWGDVARESSWRTLRTSGFSKPGNPLVRPARLLHRHRGLQGEICTHILLRPLHLEMAPAPPALSPNGSGKKMMDMKAEIL